jgi:hypothetical protein
LKDDDQLLIEEDELNRELTEQGIFSQSSNCEIVTSGNFREVVAPIRDYAEF